MWEPFDNDIVLNEVKNNYGGYQAWSVDEEGKIEPLSIDREAHKHDVEIPMHWADLEDQKASHGFNLIPVRLFSTQRLMQDQRWKEQAEFLHGACYINIYPTGCLYPYMGYRKLSSALFESNTP